VALRVPEGRILAHANQARITTFLPCTDQDWCMASADAASFAVENGLYPGSATDPDFSFSDVYDPLTPTGARFCEARVWYVYSQLADPGESSGIRTSRLGSEPTRFTSAGREVRGQVVSIRPSADSSTGWLGSQFGLHEYGRHCPISRYH
jgi:dipeptidase